MTTTAEKAGRKAIVTTPSDREIRFERIFDAPRERVWRACTEPKLLAQWWARGNQMDVERYELKTGGHWRVVEHTPQGSFGFEGRFGEITPGERVVQTFEWDGMPAHPCRETMEYIDLGDGRTKLVGTSIFFTQQERDGMLQHGMEGGMNQSHAALDALLERIG